LTQEDAVKAIVVYESHWGNTAAIARAIAAGLGPGAAAVSTQEASDAVMAGADLLVAGAPVLGFRLPSDGFLASLATNPGNSPAPADFTGPSLRSWLERLPAGSGRAAAFETRLWWSPGGATGAIVDGLKRAGYRTVDTPHRFMVKGKYGPLRDGELERAHQWGAALAAALG
jgi:menaquinone-dependent protoporphyrinogen IX oxidase